MAKVLLALLCLLPPIGYALDQRKRANQNAERASRAEQVRKLRDAQLELAYARCPSRKEAS